MERPEIGGRRVNANTKYAQIIAWIFRKRFDGSARRVWFPRSDLVDASEALAIPRVSNLGDIPYSFRFRSDLPGTIQETAPMGMEWIILGAGIGGYEFRLASKGRIQPAENRAKVKIPDATPEIVRLYAPGTDEQALLTRVRYNRLIDVFTGLTCYSVQNHLRTTVPGIGQIEVDEIYVGVNRHGAHFVIPCQAKSKKDQFGIGQVIQDRELCKVRYPAAKCRSVALQFLNTNSVAMLELREEEEDEILHLRVVEEKHYNLVPRSDISDDELRSLMNAEL